MLSLVHAAVASATSKLVEPFNGFSQALLRKVDAGYRRTTVILHSISSSLKKERLVDVSGFNQPRPTKGILVAITVMN